MKKLWFAFIVLTMTLAACVGPAQTQSPSAIPVQPSQIPEPTLVEATEAPTAIPPTPIPPTEIPPTEVPPTEPPVVPTAEPTKVWVFTPNVASGEEIVFQEDFSNSKLTWPESSNERIARAFVGGEFLMNVIATDRVGWHHVPDVVYDHDVILDVDVRGGANFAADAEAGFVCGFENNDNFYRMVVGGNGDVKFVRRLNDENETIYKGTAEMVLDPSGTHLTGVCTQNEISLYVNQQLVGTQKIDGLPAGSAGLVGGSNDTGNVELYFDNFYISKGIGTSMAPMTEPAETWAFTPNVASGNEVVLAYDFSEPKFGWGSTSEEVKREYVDGEFFVNVKAKNYVTWNVMLDLVYDHDVVLDIDVRGGFNFAEDAEAGFVCGREDKNNFYRMSVSSSGEVKFVRKQNEENKTIYSSVEPVTLDPSGTHLTGVCAQNEISLYVNRQLVGTCPIDDLPAGRVGFMSGSNETDNVELYFDNFYVSKGFDPSLMPASKPVEVRAFTPNVTSGTEIVFAYDFSEPRSGWGDSNETTKRAFLNGELFMNLLSKNIVGWNVLSTVVYDHDVVLDVDVRGGVNFAEDAEAGFVCGFENSNNLFRMAVGADGDVKFVQKINDENTTIFTGNAGIALDPAGTHLTGVCTQNELSLYVNQQLVGTKKIDGLPAGTAGILSGSNDTGNVELYFDNFYVSKGPYSFGD